MKAIPAAILLLALASANAAAAEGAAVDAEQDRLMYLTSLGVPALRKPCSALYPSFADGIDAMFELWRPRHEEQIARGRAAQVAALAPDSTIEQWEQATAVAIGKDFATAPADRKDARCLGLITALGR